LVKLDMTKHIALIGCGLRMPQNVQSLDDLWDVLKNGRDHVTETPQNRWNNDLYFHQDRDAKGTSVSKWGGFLDGIDQFDPVAFGLSPREAAVMDPQQRLALITSLEAIEDAGMSVDQLQQSRVGVFFGVSTWDYAVLQYSPFTMNDPDIYSATGMAHSVVANRVSYCLNLSGPSLSVDTACSSSLMAVHLAAQSIASGESTMAIAGGVNCILGPSNTIAFSKMGILSATGRCRAFSGEADGFVRAEGAGAILMMPVEQARNLGMHNYAVIEATAANQDGRTNGLAVPSGDAQAALLKSIYNKRNINPDDLGYFEAHGTGTLVGDAIEAHSISAVAEQRSRKGKLVIGSAKTNFGHMEPASGILGLFKAMLVCDRGEIPTNLHFKTPSKHIDFDKLGISVAQGCLPLGAGSVVGVNSFGFGGANVHVALRAQIHQLGPSDIVTPVLSVPSPVFEPQPYYHLCLSAVSNAHLLQSIKDAEALLLADDTDFRAILSAYARKRTERQFRMSFAVKDRDDLLAQLRATIETAGDAPTLQNVTKAREQAPKAVFYFTGQGSQWLGMGQGLMQSSAVFREVYLQCDDVVREETGFSLNEEMQGTAALAGVVEKTSLAQPAIVAFQIALSEMLIRQAGVQVAGVIGHSVGEIAAAYVAGVFSLRDAMALAVRRGQLVERKALPGKMLVVKASQDVQEKHLQAFPEIEVCAYNSPDLLSVGGPAEVVKQLRKTLRADKVICREMPMPYAFHTALIDGCKDGFDDVFADLDPQRAKIPFYSTVTGQRRYKLDKAYWWKNLRNPVQFSSAVNCAANDGCNSFIEISPNPTLVGQTLDCLQHNNHDAEVIATGATNNEAQSVARAIGRLWQRNAGARLDIFEPKHADMHLVRLPRYPWVNQRLWLEPAESMQLRTQPRVSRLLGQRLPGTSNEWLLNTDAKHFPMIEQHLFNQSPLFPATGFLEMFIAAATELQQTENVALADMEILAGLFLGGNHKSIQFRLKQNAVTDTLEVFSRLDSSNDVWARNARAAYVPFMADAFSGRLADTENVKSAGASWYHGDLIYDNCALSQLQYDRRLQLVKEVWSTPNEVVANIDASSLCDLDDFFIHPAVMDACLHPTNLNREHHFGIDATHFTFVPVRFGRIELFRKLRGKRFTVHVKKTADTLRYSIGDLTIYDETGAAVLHIKRFESLGLEISSERGEANFDKYSYGIQWLTERNLDGINNYGSNT